jgi:ribosomal protein S18 acetylase RimI-like enzyme
MTRAAREVTEDDVPTVVALIRESLPTQPVDEAEIRAWLDDPGEAWLALVEDEHGAPMAYADLAEPDHEAGRIWLFLCVPERNGDDETIAAAVDWAEGTALGKGLRVVRAPVTPGSSSARFLGATGYRAIRHSFQMRIGLDGAPTEPEWPDGIDVSPLEPGQERAVYDTIEAAFADHWDWTSPSFEEWRHHMAGSESLDPSLWLIARDGDEIAGACICRWAPGEPELGWVRQLGVRPPWRRRGLGMALLVGAFGLFRERGATSVGLGVDGENTTGAVGLYERAGMHVHHRLDTYDKELR